MLFADQMLIGVSLKIVQNPGLTLILYEEFARFRQISTDGASNLPWPVQRGAVIRLERGTRSCPMQFATWPIPK